MVTGPQGTQVPELFEHLLEAYNAREVGMAGEVPGPAPIDGLFEHFHTQQELDAAAEALNHFLAFCRQYMLEHPPQTQIMLSEGFGVTLAGGVNVCLVPPIYDNINRMGDMEPSNAVSITKGASMRGRDGITDTQSVAVTGGHYGV